MTIITLIIMLLITLLIFLQAPKQETLGNAFNGETHTPKITIRLRLITFSLFFIVSILLLISHFYNWFWGVLYRHIQTLNCTKNSSW
jgi:preprotein translocase subunit SecG